MATTTPDNIQYPVGTDQVAPLANHFKNLADSTQAALNTKPDTTELPDVITHLNAADYIKFDTTYTGGSTQPGMLNWNDTDGTLEFQLKGGNVTLQIGQEQVVRVKNDTGAALANGKAVYISGSNGVNLLASYANAGAENTSSQTIGITTEEIGSNQHGFVTTFGLVRNINTNNLVEGAAVWLDTTNGGLTATRPAAPNHGVLLGFCLRKSATVGVVFVRVDNGWELDELHNVSITSPADKQVLAYEASSQLWKNKQATGGVTVGASAPANPNPGDAWFDSNDGTLYVWYVDTDTSQWVQVQANSALEASILARLGSLEAQAIAYGNQNPNVIINGAFDIWQRGLSFGSEQYNADRWYGTNLAGTWSREETVVPAGFRYAMKFVASASGTPYLMQPIETSVAYPYAGKIVTLSAYVATSATRTSQVTVQYSTTVDNAQINAWTTLSPTSGGSATTTGSVYSRISGTFAVPSTAKSIRVYVTTSASVSGDIMYITGVQLEIGSTTTSFRRNQPNIQAELAACQRYYYRMNFNSTNNPADIRAMQYTNTGGVAFLTLPTTMRITPVSADGSPSSSFRVVYYNGSGAYAVSTLTSLGYSTSGSSPSTIYFSTAYSGTNGYVYGWIDASTTPAYLGWSAEL